MRSRRPVINGELQDGEDFLQIASLDAINTQHDRDRETVNKILYKVENAPSIKFLRREREVMPVEFSLSYVDNAAAQAEGAGFSHEFPVHIKRQALTAHRTTTGETVVQVQQVKEEMATQRYMPVADVRADFVERILDLGLVASTTHELTAAERIAEQFLLAADVVGDENEADWSERRASQAVRCHIELDPFELQQPPTQPSMGVPYGRSADSPAHAHRYGRQVGQLRQEPLVRRMEA
ncbi:hypothetical protein [Amycolatopsis silviterrae]|uniref:Uncharacterized protein n=1 Tax=Amycolatopsis silviterrae TaxID=1656914 RepID=A0ABW5GZ88_9PSEU